MDEKKIKDSISEFIGEEKLFNDHLKNRIMYGVKKKHKGVFSIFKKLTPAFVLLLMIIGFTALYLLSNTDDKQQLSSTDGEIIKTQSPNSEATAQGVEQGINVWSDEQLQFHDQFREALNLTFKIINAMIELDYTYLTEISDTSVEINTTGNTLYYNSIGADGYEDALIKDFDYKNFDYRGYSVEGDSIIIILGIHSASYEFTFIKGESIHGNYLLKSIFTN
ncbi:hypothetical protein [Solibacillus sp. CAU 1738]|uniref:hypothetical protein n=1 Tax=Solibacillus sp. CAU 1738 TaxID=3140363 RepID=UPI003261A005